MLSVVRGAAYERKMPQRRQRGESYNGRSSEAVQRQHGDASEEGVGEVKWPEEAQGKDAASPVRVEHTNAEQRLGTVRQLRGPEQTNVDLGCRKCAQTMHVRCERDGPCIVVGVVGDVDVRDARVVDAIKEHCGIV